MARSSECTEQYAQKVLDTADIVRDAWLHQLGKSRVHSALARTSKKPRGRAAVAALLRHAQHLGSLNRNAFPRGAPGYLEEEVAGRVVEIQGEGTVVRLAAVSYSDR